MGKLAEYLKAEADNLKAERLKRKEAVEEWKQSLERLYVTLSGWIAEADDGQGLIGAHDQYQYMVEEPRLGAYWTKKLTVLMGAFEAGIAVSVAEVVPRARFVLATLKPTGREPRPADGMVEIREGKDGKIANYYLFRWKNPDGDEWFICSDAVWNSRDYGNVDPLTAEAFEAAVLSTVQ
jgi:predicted metal-dependent phosphoesterase TrpH